MNTTSDEEKKEEKKPGARFTSKKPWVEPEITWHKPLKEITLGIQCTTTPGGCSSVQDPFV